MTELIIGKIYKDIHDTYLVLDKYPDLNLKDSGWLYLILFISRTSTEIYEPISSFPESVLLDYVSLKEIS